MEWILLAQKPFYESNIRSILIYGARAWFTILSDQCKEKLESIHRSAARVIFPDLAYEDRLELLVLQTLSDFVFSNCKRYFNRICPNPDHPLYTRITFNEVCKPSSRSKTIFRPTISKTQKCSESFFQSLWDLLLTAISMFNERAILCFVSFVSSHSVLSPGFSWKI